MTKKSVIIGVFGTRGAGKSAWIRRYIQNLNRVVIIDNGNAEFDNDVDSIVLSQNDFAATVIDKTKFKILYSEGSGDMLKGLDDMLDVCKAYTFDMKSKYNTSTSITIIIDEAQEFTSAWKIPQSLRSAIMRSRHLDFNIIYSTQRPSQIARALTSQSDRFIIYKLTEPNDVKYFNGFIGKASEEIPLLPKYHYLDCDLNSQKIIEKMLY